MSIIKRINKRLKSDETTGFGSNSNENSGRFYNKNGYPNVVKRGIGYTEALSYYHSLINMSTKKFLLLIFLAYVILNLVFACVYSIIGIEYLEGAHQGNFWENFLEMFFFSTQTFTTVGYGRISPIGIFANSVATFEAFLGLLSFALATGLFFARFAKPQSHLRFSKQALISPFKDGMALMFRLAPVKNNLLSEAEVKMTLAIKEKTETGDWINKFYVLDTQISKINMISLSWTIVHPISANSPLFEFSAEVIKNAQMEVLVFIKAFDEIHSNQVVARTSYTSAEIVWNAKFVKMYGPDENNETTILDFNLMDKIDILD